MEARRDFFDRHRGAIIATATALCTITISAFVLIAAYPLRGTVAEDPVETVVPPEPEPRILPLEGPWVVAIQPGHWKIDELPAEHAHRRANFGASFRGVREVDVNIAVTEALVPLLEAEGWTVQVIPATVPPGLRADAFLSIHADWGADPNRTGFKLAPPWRPSPAAGDLARALAASFRSAGVREDVGGITVGMRGYFGFASHRFHHASSPYTPATLVELGFLTNDSERTRMANEPEFYASIIHRGLVSYFSGRVRTETESLIPREFPMLVASAHGAAVHRVANPASAVIRQLQPGETIRPVDEHDGWYEVRIRTPALTGWVRSDEVVPFGTARPPLTAPPPSATSDARG